MKKIILSAALAAGLFAGTIKSTNAVNLIGQERISIASANVNYPIGDITYTPQNIPAMTLSNPVFEYTIGGAKNVKIGSKIAVWECKDGNDTNTSSGNWKLIANAPQVYGDNKNIITFVSINSNVKVVNTHKYIIGEGSSNENNATFVSKNAFITIPIPQNDSSNITVKASLFSRNTQAEVDYSNAYTIGKIGPEYTGSIVKKFSKTIDASQNFNKFYGFSGIKATTDSAIFNIHQNKVLKGSSLDTNSTYISVFFDKNASKYITAASTGWKLNDTNATTISKPDTNTTLSLTVNPKSPNQIKRTVFTASAYVKSGSHIFTIIPKITQNAGQWSINGYSAQIPNVSATFNTMTVFKFTNRSSLTQNIFFTLIDPKGTVVTLSSKNYPIKLPSIKANATNKYLASTLASLAKIKNPNFNTKWSFSVEVTISATPSDIYGVASFRNTVLNQFKMLPIYSNSKLSY